MHNHFIKRTMSSLTPGFHSTLYCSNEMATQIRECRQGQFHPHFSTVEFKLQNTYPKVETKCFIYLHYSSRNHPKDCPPKHGNSSLHHVEQLIWDIKSIIPTAFLSKEESKNGPSLCKTYFLVSRMCS